MIAIHTQASAFAGEGSRLAGLASRLADLLAHRSRHRAVRNAVGRPVFASIRARQPQLSRKYLNPLHLAIGLTSDERAALMIHHYDFLATRLPAACLNTIFTHGMCLWSRDSEAGHHQVDLLFSHPTDNEGELTLKYTLDRVTLSVCSFSFAPGSLVKSPDDTIIAITLIQGVRADLDRLRAAISAVSVTPAMVFLAILTGIAEHFGIATIAGVAASAQPARKPGNEDGFAAVYDSFFESVGGVRVTPIFYRIALPRLERPLAEAKRNHRARTKLQREIRTEIARVARAAFGAQEMRASTAA